jgi:hypothetical protein
MFKLMELGWKKYQLSKYFIRIIIYLVPFGFKVGSGLMPFLINTTLIIILAVSFLRLIIERYKNRDSVPIFNIMSMVYIIMQ